MKTIFTPPGYRLELVASEPMIQDPILIDFDPDGRLWAIEMPGFMPDLPATTERDPTGRIVVLEDVDDDGKMDKRTIFLDGLVLPRALKVLDRGVLVGEPPNLWLARDTNGDLRADTKELVTDTYGQREAGPEHNANGLMWGLDNWIYTSEHDSYLRLKNGRFEVQKTLSRGQWGLSMDDGGRIYRNTNEAALFVDLVPARYFMRHPGLLRTRGAYESLNSEGVNTVWPVRPTRGVNRGYQERRAAARWPAGAVHVGQRADGVSRRPAPAGALRQRLRRRAGRQSRLPADRQRRRDRAESAEGVRGR